ncbi:unnamed protein product [Adineta steineri]|uniref:RRM domain-containing protein n=1 Tax=Adineta steineri TaxID=433720 RepID=A0A818VBG9_9BILA|nr:unnamed protein product [Adineta steineri]CAF1346186.1 unnamed protein product [Adineta steineri]CAF3583138.1 unnamed protein product [Adineta steineri]CAF3712753.1 unnamed protein product [Adineta steineri]
MSGPRRNNQQQQQRGGNTNNYMSNNNRNNTSNMGGYGGQGIKRMRGDDFHNDNANSAHRMKWDSPDDDNRPMTFMERNDIDQRSDVFGQFTNTTMNETTVLCLTVQNAKYPITLDVIRKICSITGQILRICILRKRIIQVLIEFDSFETARKVKDELDGADIYSGCCTLKIDYANLKHLVVRGNDQDNLDLTVDENRYTRRRTLLSSPPRTDHFEPPLMNNDSFSSNTRFASSLASGLDRFLNQRIAPLDRSSPRDNPGNFPQQQQQQQQQPLFDTNPQFLVQQLESLDRQRQFLPYPIESDRFREPSPPSSIKTDSSVFNVEGLSSPRWNCDRLFNFLCIYGNVLRVKFLKSKQGGAMVQMSRCESLQQHLKSLNSTFIFGQTFIIVSSRQSEIQPLNRPFPLENGDASYMEYDTSRNNRYLTSDQAVKNRPVAPSHVLYYFNTPPHMAEIDIVRLFEDLGAKRPIKVKNFLTRKDATTTHDRRGNTQPKGVTGLAEFRTITDACECLILANNYPIPHQSSSWPFFFKLTFSGTPISDSDALCGEDMDTSLATVTIESGRHYHRQKAATDDNRNKTFPGEHRRRRHSSPSP